MTPAEREVAAIHNRCATLLGWDPRDVAAFPLATLRELVREKDPRLAAATTEQINRGDHVATTYAPRRGR